MASNSMQKMVFVFLPVLSSVAFVKLIKSVKTPLVPVLVSQALSKMLMDVALTSASARPKIQKISQYSGVIDHSEKDTLKVIAALLEESIYLEETN